MELNLFIKELENSLIKRGINPDVADKHVHTLLRTFTEEDLREIKNIQSPNEVEDIAESIALILKKNKAKANEPKTADPGTEPKKTTKAPETVKQAEAPSAPPIIQQKDIAPKEAPVRPVKNSVPNQAKEPVQKREPIPKQKPAPVYDDDLDYYEDYSDQPTQKGFYTFWITFIVTLPITILLGLAFFGVFFGVMAAMAALIVGLIVGLIGLVAVGAGVSLVGIIFGITQLFSFVAAGIYEIGLGVMIIGIVMLAGILIYNFAIRFLPWLIRKVWQLMMFTCGKIKELFYYLRRECYKL